MQVVAMAESVVWIYWFHFLIIYDSGYMDIPWEEL
jgi:hypothetical protein